MNSVQIQCLKCRHYRFCDGRKVCVVVDDGMTWSYRDADLGISENSEVWSFDLKKKVVNKIARAQNQEIRYWQGV